ncbi:MAG TPA: hypothetical protein VGN57_16090 [Pirellulaceae bacterium]|jgi:hypothetical protein|nr:hypothetical protein [Pirellulaceae bacterium]
MILFRFVAMVVLLSRIAFVRSVPINALVFGGLPAIWSFANIAAASLLILVSLTLIATVYAEQPRRQCDLASWSLLPLCVLFDVCTGYPISAMFSPFAD